MQHINQQQEIEMLRNMQNIRKKISKTSLVRDMRGKKNLKFEEELDVKIQMKTLFNL